MTNQEYLFKLLGLCTGDQKDLFDRMYPDGVSKSKVGQAIRQVENTLLNLNKKLELSRKEFNEAVQVIDDLKNEQFILEKDNEEKSLELNKLAYVLEVTKEVGRRIERGENSITPEIQERLDLLDALEEGGVDNWDWYGESISNWWRRQNA